MVHDGENETIDVGEIDVGGISAGESRLITTRFQLRQEVARQAIAVGLVIIFAVTIIWVLYAATIDRPETWVNTKEALQILLPVEASLLGSAVGYYFATSSDRSD